MSLLTLALLLITSAHADPAAYTMGAEGSNTAFCGDSPTSYIVVAESLAYPQTSPSGYEAGTVTFDLLDDTSYLVCNYELVTTWPTESAEYPAGRSDFDYEYDTIEDVLTAYFPSSYCESDDETEQTDCMHALAGADNTYVMVYVEPLDPGDTGTTDTADTGTDTDQPADSDPGTPTDTSSVEGGSGAKVSPVVCGCANGQPLHSSWIGLLFLMLTLRRRR